MWMQPRPTTFVGLGVFLISAMLLAGHHRRVDDPPKGGGPVVFPLRCQVIDLTYANRLEVAIEHVGVMHRAVLPLIEGVLRRGETGSDILTAVGRKLVSMVG